MKKCSACSASWQKVLVESIFFTNKQKQPPPHTHKTQQTKNIYDFLFSVFYYVLLVSIEYINKYAYIFRHYIIKNLIKNFPAPICNCTETSCLSHYMLQESKS